MKIKFQGVANIASPKNCPAKERNENIRDELSWLVDNYPEQDVMVSARQIAHAEKDGWQILDWICCRMEGDVLVWKALM